MDTWRRQGLARLWRSIAIHGPVALPAQARLRRPARRPRTGGQRAGVRGPLRAALSRHPLLLPSHARLQRGGRRRGSADLCQCLSRAARRRPRAQFQAMALPDRAQPVHQRAASPTRDGELGDDEPSLLGLSDQVAAARELRDLLGDLARLPADQREALVLAELHDNSHVEVAGDPRLRAGEGEVTRVPGAQLADQEP